MLLFQGTQSVCKSFIFSLMPSLRHSQEADHFITIKKIEISRDASAEKGNRSWIWCKIFLLPFPKAPSLQPWRTGRTGGLLKGKFGPSFPLLVVQCETLSGLSLQPSLDHFLHSGCCTDTSCRELGTLESFPRKRVHGRAMCYVMLPRKQAGMGVSGTRKEGNQARKGEIKLS